jgi:RecJ-like exonuclease
MGTCIICGASVPEWVCESHEEDVYFLFEGDAADELSAGRYYRGTVDGYADFGVFINIGQNVTGLLHTSELDRRLESLDWEPGDPIFVQVKNVRDNGDVDLGWSIRQHESEFRGGLIDSPEGMQRIEDNQSTGPSTDQEPTQQSEVANSQQGNQALTEASVSTRESQDTSDDEPEAQLDRSSVASLDDLVGRVSTVAGKVSQIRQTSGPTLFTIQDETGEIECAAFEAAGVRAYPDIDEGDIVRVTGEVENRRGSLQIETSDLEPLEGSEKQQVLSRIENELAEKSRPPSEELLAEFPGILGIHDEIITAATAIRRAVFDRRPVVVRHTATTDGYVAGAAIERAVLPLIEAEHDEDDAPYHYFDRRPLDGRIYGMQDAMRDTTQLLDAQERHNERPPLFVFAGAASTDESYDSLELLNIYDANTLVIDDAYPDPPDETVDVFVNPHTTGDTDDVSDVTTTGLATNIAIHVNPDITTAVQHLPAISYWNDIPPEYETLAIDAGYDRSQISTVREAIAIEAFYQSYEDKREIIAGILFDAHPIANHASEQFQERVGEALRTATPHLDTLTTQGNSLGILDIDAYTRRFEFPPDEILLKEIASQNQPIDAVIGLREDELVIWSQSTIDMESIGQKIADEVENGGVSTRGGRDGTVVFLVGKRQAVKDTAITAVSQALNG